MTSIGFSSHRGQAHEAQARTARCITSGRRRARSRNEAPHVAGQRVDRHVATIANAWVPWLRALPTRRPVVGFALTDGRPCIQSVHDCLVPLLHALTKHVRQKWGLERISGGGFYRAACGGAVRARFDAQQMGGDICRHIASGVSGEHRRHGTLLDQGRSSTSCTRGYSFSGSEQPTVPPSARQNRLQP